MDKFRNIWSKYDEAGTGFIDIEDFHIFLSDLGEPLGFSYLEK